MNTRIFCAALPIFIFGCVAEQDGTDVEPRVNHEVWARIETDSLGGVAILEEDGVASVALAGVDHNSIDATFDEAFASADYAAVVSSADGVPYVIVTEDANSTASKVRIQAYNTPSTLVDLRDTVVRISLHVYGR